MDTTFEFLSDESLMKFQRGAIKGGIYLASDPLLISVNGPYPLEGLSEEELAAGIEAVRRDFLAFTGFTGKRFHCIAKRLEADGRCFIYSYRYEADGQCIVEKQPIDKVLESIAPEEVAGGEMIKGFLVKVQENTIWAFEPVYHFFASIGIAEDHDTLNLRVFTTESSLIDDEERRQEQLVNKLMEEVLPELAQKHPQFKLKPKEKKADPQTMYQDLCSFLARLDLSSVPLEPRRIEVSTGEPVNMKLGFLFGFRAIREQSPGEHLEVFTDGSGYWLKTTFPAEKGESVVLFEPKTREEILDVATLAIFGPKRSGSSSVEIN